MDGGRDAGRDDETRRMSDNETMEREENTRRWTRRERGMTTMVYETMAMSVLI